jgi:ABC-2 type transport system ATP-binding protein
MIASLRDLGKTIFLTTHYMDEAQALADRAAIIAEGRIIAEGNPDELGGRDSAQAVISFRLPEGASAGGLPGAFAEAAARPGGDEISLTSSDPVADLGALLDWARNNGGELPQLEVRRPSLEEVYLELTGAAAQAQLDRAAER